LVGGCAEICGIPDPAYLCIEQHRKRHIQPIHLLPVLDDKKTARAFLALFLSLAIGFLVLQIVDSAQDKSTGLKVTLKLRSEVPTILELYHRTQSEVTFSFETRQVSETVPMQEDHAVVYEIAELNTLRDLRLDLGGADNTFTLYEIEFASDWRLLKLSGRDLAPALIGNDHVLGIETEANTALIKTRWGIRLLPLSQSFPSVSLIWRTDSSILDFVSIRNGCDCSFFLDHLQEA
jgi:hypothetical protein